MTVFTAEMKASFFQFLTDHWGQVQPIGPGVWEGAQRWDDLVKVLCSKTRLPPGKLEGQNSQEMIQNFLQTCSDDSFESLVSMVPFVDKRPDSDPRSLANLERYSAHLGILGIPLEVAGGWGYGTLVRLYKHADSE